ncbi:hypothetical protein CHS0354_039199 [Potamilus streckersoni]|uniref:Uncharacterized protein n=1 Tax=Potamilus streckersoni TaxID=2493646 RepID=A0AAE0TE11_9BIVA|nr:hypothetical protein CHS0354_039199 [Potamilus streckersoni]
MAAIKFVGIIGVVLLWYFLPGFAEALYPSRILQLALYGILTVISWKILTSKKFVAVDPSNKAVLITGCDSGFGNQLSHKLDALGYTVFAGCLQPDREGAQKLKMSCSDRLMIIPLDVTDDWQVRGAVKTVKENLKDKVLWAVVNNAGVAIFTEIEWCSVTQFQRIMDVNVLGVVRVTKLFLPFIREAEGRIINVASLAGRFTLPAFGAYSMSKKACIAFSDALRQEMAKFNVRVITIEPGLYKTPISETDNLINMNRKSWSETPTEVKDVYGEEYFDAFLKNITEQMKRARPNVNEVIERMLDAVTNESPKSRYVPYWLSKIRLIILAHLPSSVTDKLLNVYMPNIKPSNE